MRRAIPGGPAGWAPERLIFRDFWHWRDHELGFAHGRLALTGQNGSGKSSLLALCLPTLLDGETSGARLDPALSRDRHLYWYLLGDEQADPEQADAFRYEARTGYFALELRHGATGRWLTIGMGVSAARNHPRLLREWWGFIVPDRRLGRDWEVRGPDRNCLGLRDLQKALAPPALVTDERSEYRRQINARLFGMTDDQHLALTAMLLQARRPKLGEQAGPEQVCRLLLDALPAVPGEHLERVVEVVDNIERYRRTLQATRRRAEAVAEVDRLQHALAGVLVQEAARAYQEVAGGLGNLAGRLQRTRAALAAAETRLAGLREAGARREIRLAQVRAELEAYRERPDADLPERLQEARAAAARDREHLQRVEALAARAEADLGGHEQALGGLEARFAARRRDLAAEWQRLGRQAADGGWAEGQRVLAEAARALEAAALAAGASALAGAWPPPALPAQAAALAASYRDLGLRRRACDEREAEVRRHQEELDRLQLQQVAAAEAERRAEERLEALRAGLLEDVERWRAASPALALPPEALAPLVLALQGLEQVPAEGPAGLLGPLRQAAEARRRDLDAGRQQALRETGQAAVAVEALAREQDALQQHGLLPARSALRQAARAGMEGPDAPRPVFRWIRFREGIDEQTAARVEAAGLEAGLWDLVPGGQAADAWLAAENAGGAGAHTLLEILAAEPDAPAEVHRLLASIGWGDGAERWIAADGRWRNGAASGQVLPWLQAAGGGLVGAERRAAAEQARRSALGRAREAAEGRRAAAEALAAAAQAAANALDGELAAAELLPWQGLFSALQDRSLARQAADAASERSAAARPAYDAAYGRYGQARDGYEGALGLLPQARGLDQDGLRTRAEALDRTAHRLGELRPDELLALAREHAERLARRAQDAEGLAALRAQLAGLRPGLAASEAQAEALQRRAADPSVALLHRQSAELHAEQDRLAAEGQGQAAEMQELDRQAAGQRTLIREREPEEAELRTRSAERLVRLRQRMGLHEGFEEHLAALEREGPVAALPRIPHPVEDADPALLEQAVQERKADLQAYIHANRDVLDEERPSRLPAWEGLVFWRDREQFTPAALTRRLGEEVEHQEQLIAEEQRRLFERIIHHGTLDALRELIREARGFTARTNDKLRALRLSGGERLSLRLVAQEVAVMPGAAVGRALEEADQAAQWLSPERREVLVRQIQAEVDRAREDASARGENLGYHEAIRTALDYRRWYEYQLWSQLPGASQPAQIRSRGFGRRSTSAKAWALAVPVLAGVAARYDAATQRDAPRLVGLDEAFAGLDPNNQANYLQFLQDLDLRWILTCPDELPYNGALSAAMAYRLELTGNVHTTFPVLWDGRRATEPMAATWDQVAAGAAEAPPALEGGPGLP